MVSLTPPLKPAPDSKIGAFIQSGKWDMRDFAELNKLSESLNIELNAPSWLELSGIPDMWARPILFDIALFDMNHVLHKRTLGEWRGLLALLALREINNFSMRTEEIVIDSRNSFLNALSLLRPDKIIDSSVNWSKLFIIYFNDTPIGITSPSTLVCTTASQVNLGNIPWVNESRLCDPVDYLNDAKKGKLFTWIQTLEKEIRSKLAPANLAGSHLLFQLLDEFKRSLGVSGLPVSQGVNIFQFTGIHRVLNIPVARDNSAISHLAIKGQNGSILDQIIIADTNIATQWGINPHEVIIYGDVTLDQIPLGGFQNDKFVGSHPLQQHRVWETKKLFTNKLYLFEQNNALPQAYISEGGDSLNIDGELCTPIAPLAKELLDYYSEDELSKRVTYHMDSDGISVAICITLTGINNQPKEYRAVRKYLRSENEIVHISSVPLLAIWPNFTSPNWHLYYSFYRDESGSGLEMNPYFARDENVSVKRDIRGGQVFQLSTFPYAYLCKVDDNFAGLLLVKKPDPISSVTNSKWNVGVDFGTTGTNLYYMTNEANMSAQFPTLKRRHIIITQTNEEEQLNLLFLPNQDQSKTFLSIFRDVSGTGCEPYNSILDGHILYLHDSVASLKKYEDKQEKGSLRDDLKWGGAESSDEGIHKLVKAFIEQLCIQTMAEAAYQGVESVSWRFSYPSSFSYDLRNHFNSACDSTIEKCHIKSGLSGGSVSYEPESVSAAKYFHGTIGETFAAGAICIDIGGGTSDISIWRNNLVWQSSIRFAGRDIFTEELLNHEDLRKLLGLISIPSERYSRIAAESSIRSDADSALSKLNVVFMKPAVKTLQQKICFSLAAIFYYVGLAVKNLVAKGLYNITDCPNIYIAGGGSKLFHWAAGGKFTENHEIGNLFKHVFISAAGLGSFPASTKLILSPKPKHEAAIGLVNNSTLQYENSILNSEYLAGESIIVNGKEIKWDDYINANKIAGKSIVRTTPANLINFINVFNSQCQNYAISPIKYEPLLPELGRAAEEVFSQYGDQTELKIQLEPIFITYIKNLLKLLGN